MKSKLAALVLAAATLFSSAAMADVQKIRIIGSLPLGHHMSKALTVFKKAVEGKTKIKVDTFPASQLYNDSDSVRVLPTGSVDMGVVQLDMWMGLVPSAGILYMPTYYDSLDQFYAIRKFVTPMLSERLEAKANVKLLGWADYDSEALISKKKLEKLEDFKGTKLRGYGQYAAAFLQSLGSSPVVMSSSEAYDSLAKGVIDGTMSGPTSHYSRKFFEVADYLISQKTFIQPVFCYAILINLDTWKKLSAAEKTAVQAGADEIQTYTSDAFQKATAEALAALEKKGVTMVDIVPAEFERIKAVVRPALEAKLEKDAGADVAKPILDYVRSLRSK
ncbi:TRAP transporter substrate-binding protein DctP [Oleispirillum naphthae]|uniref:TRAP transporter substrate-binding protein n=1 Tax=Oleispirillum naphthae TaxID=2838853 RepID=UPI0030823D1C